MNAEEVGEDRIPLYVTIVGKDQCKARVTTVKDVKIKEVIEDEKLSDYFE